LGEVCFVPRGKENSKDMNEEDQGYLMGFLFNGEKKSTELVIFDANNVSKGPISRTQLDYMINFALHGTWIPGFTPKFTPEIEALFAQL
jgi:all-trans-8'-apo-beta-carotenal 15,15'-oxygenase